MRITPRDYQLEAVQSLYSYFACQQGNPVVAMPTGTGKSIVIAMFLESIYRHYPRQRVLVLTHVKELIQQNYDELLGLWPTAPAGINSAGLGRRDTLHRIIFAGIASVAKHAQHMGHVDLVLIDEAHLVSPNDATMYQKFLDGLRSTNKSLKVIGFTATPWRLGQGHITDGSVFTDICFDITTVSAFNRLIAEGYLSPVVPKRTQALLDTSGVHMRGGDFILSELQHAVDKESITRAALAEALHLGADRKHWLVFAAGVEHADNVAAELTLQGVPAVSVHSKMTSAARDEAIAGFKSGKYRAAVNNNVLTTGFNFPAIDMIVMLRPTASPVLWVQMLGRGTRPAAGKQNCLVLDFAGNTRRLGPINDPVVPRKKGGKGGEAPVKLCEACDTYNHASVRWCEFCGAEFVFKVRLAATAATADLLRGDAPVTEVFTVDHITYTRHNKVGKPPMVKVGYYCGYRVFYEYVCFQHEGFARRKAEQWWKLRTDMHVPETTAHALSIAHKLRASTHIRVWTNKEFPEILAHCFDGSKFGADVVTLPQLPTVSVQDDEIPF